MEKAYPLDLHRNNKNRYHIIIGSISWRKGLFFIYDKIIVNQNKPFPTLFSKEQNR